MGTAKKQQNKPSHFNFALGNKFKFDKSVKMARRYDTRTTIFSPEGRLYQVEYAMEAIGHAGTCLGILSNDGILLAGERRNTNKLLDEVFHSEKICRLNENMACSVAGITSDANVLTNELRLIGQRYFYQYEETMPCEQLVSFVCDMKQEYTQGEMSLNDALDLSVKVLSKTLDMTKLTPDKIELSTLQRKGDKTEIRILPANEVEELIKKYEAAEKAAEDAKREKEKQAQQKKP